MEHTGLREGWNEERNGTEHRNGTKEHRIVGNLSPLYQPLTFHLNVTTSSGRSRSVDPKKLSAGTYQLTRLYVVCVFEFVLSIFGFTGLVT